LVDAGNVRAVFGGHIHRMRYDPRDGIEYVTLATVGGHQRSLSPDGGWLHEFHLVTVRPDRIAMAAVPVATLLDPRAITGDLTADLERIARVPINARTSAVLAVDGAARGEFAFELHNPSAIPIDVTVLPEARSMASGWRFGPDHLHRRLEPGATASVAMRLHRDAQPVDASLELPAVTIASEGLAGGRRYAVRPRTVEPAIVVSVPDAQRTLARRPGAVDRALDFDGVDDHLVVPGAALAVPDGPFTVEAWLQADHFDGRTGLVCRTESSEWGLFVNAGVPSFLVHLSGRYTTALPILADDGQPPLEPGRWHHLAGVYDGREVRLYLDGRQIASAAGEGSRTPNNLPIIIGGDVDGAGTATSFFDGRIDGVRIRRGAAYTGDQFVPRRNEPAEAEDLLHLRLDWSYGPWWLDGSDAEAHARIGGAGGPVPVPVAGPAEGG
ncbi:MAG: LamG-like jellyroll fold domain-containing protein, partial [Phycisphaerales bacterium]